MKSKISNLILNIMLHQKLTKFIDLIIICHIEGAPLETFGQWSSLLGNILWLISLNLTLLDRMSETHNWLSIPKFVLA